MAKQKQMTGLLRILLIVGMTCGVLLPRGGALAADAKHLNIVFVNPGKTGEVYWDMVAQTMQAAGRELDAHVEVLTSERNYRTMQELGLGVLARADKPDFLILSNEESAAVPVLEAAEAAGVKTLLLSNTLIGEDAARLGPPRRVLKTWLGDITTDLQNAGARMANALIDAARAGKRQSRDGKIHILGIGGDEITPASIARNAGLKLAVEAAPDVVVDRMLFANWTQSEAEQVTTNYLGWASRKEIRPAGIWAGNDPMALGAIKAVSAAGLVPGQDIQVVGLNWSEDALRAIRAGRLLLTDGGHFLLGGWSIVLLRDYADGCDFAAASSHVEVKTSAITRANLASVGDLIRTRAFDRIDFARFRAKAGRCGHYDFSIDALISSLAPLEGAAD